MRGVRLLIVGGALCVSVASAHAQTSGNAASPPPANRGMGPGMHGGMGMGSYGGGGPMGHGMRGGPGDTMGWSLMTPDERRQHHAKMMSFTHAKECRAYVDEHHRMVLDRAKKRGAAQPSAPMHDPCAGLAD